MSVCIESSPPQLCNVLLRKTVSCVRVFVMALLTGFLGGRLPPPPSLRAALSLFVLPTQDIAENAIVPFMKGQPKTPQCGFSARVVQILASHGVKYIAYDVMADPLIRAGVKKISDWPTIPQLYVNGEFVGGCDIVTEMNQSGELKKLLDGVKEKQAQKK